MCLLQAFGLLCYTRHNFHYHVILISVIFLSSPGPNELEHASARPDKHPAARGVVARGAGGARHAVAAGRAARAPLVTRLAAGPTPRPERRGRPTLHTRASG